MIAMRIFLLFCVFFALAGCGKKGNLYLPDAPTAPPATQPAQK
ncbi:MAG: lipoprotein [Pseudomonadota bacterium]|nr:lipoprotein [Pseudomonadota bacterium]